MDETFGHACYLVISQINYTSIFANADGPRDDASCKIGYSMLHAECNQHATSVGRY